MDQLRKQQKSRPLAQDEPAAAAHARSSAHAAAPKQQTFPFLLPPTKAEQLSVIFSSAPLFLFAVDRRNLFTVVEGRALQSLNVRKKDLIGKGFYDLFADTPEMRGLLVAAFEGATGVLRHDLRGKSFETKLTPLLDREGSVTGIIGVATDVSGHVNGGDAGRVAAASGEPATEIAAQDTNSIDRIASEFATHLSHELRSPLNSILGFAALLLNAPETQFTEQDRIYLKRIAGNANHLLQVVCQVLDLAAIHRGKLSVTLSSVNVGELAHEVIEELEGLPRPQSVKLLASIPKELHPFETDRLKVKQILINLVGNALKFTKEGTIQVRVQADRKHRPVRIDVVDSGPGISRDKLEDIFKAFDRGILPRANERGYGLGLTISRLLCELLGYQLGVVSEEGKGSTFSLHLGSPKS